VKPLSDVKPDLRDRRAVVTGGAGFLGSWLCAALLDAGCQVVSLDDESTGSTANLAECATRPGFRFIRCDVTEGLDVDGPVDIVMHLASAASPVAYAGRPIETLRAGSVGTLNALELARAHDARFVLASTSEVYGDPLVHPQVESYWGNVNPIGPRSMYDEAKRFAEAATAAYRRSYGTRTGIARIFNTYGPRMRLDDGRVVPTFVRQALRGEPLTVAGDGTQTRSLCYVTDTTAALVLLAACDDPGPINVGNPHEVSVAELADIVVNAVGPARSAGIHYVELPVDDPKSRCPVIDAARERLGWSPMVALDEGLADTIAWARESLEDAND
jgi:dTDP-glucose 4,6-dehydratase